MVTAISAIFVFFIIVLVHEGGHFAVAKLSGVKVHEFAIGMGPKLLKFTKGETDYTLRALPIGGYVRMEGEDEESDDERSINNIPVFARIAVFAAGAIMNFLLALLIFIGIAISSGAPTNEILITDEKSPAYEAGIRSGDILESINGENINIWDEYSFITTEKQYNVLNVVVNRNDKKLKFNVKPELIDKKMIGISPKSTDSKPTTIIESVQKDMPADKAGIQSGDKFIKINNKEIRNWDDIVNVINNSEGKDINVVVLRDGERLSYNVETVIRKQQNIGLNPKVSNSLFDAIKYGFNKIIFFIILMFDFLGQLFSGKVKSDQVAGPVGVISLVGQAAEVGFLNVLYMAAFLSVNLGFLNLLPIPALDGSRIMFGLIELVRGKPIDPDKEGFIHFIGFVLLLTLMVFVTYKDIARLDLF
ncbi:RIP metalloprotease RseP [Dethiothermospora halolimnae]|uniref:RIP metalloprotease RseP n=1 Tax=Dethiothermospora halolimnae TaxID=3114390 RepID=UPI003CCC0BC9